MKPLYRRILRNLGHPVQLVSWLIYQLSRGNESFFVSMPCSGTHWLRFMLAKALVEKFELDYEFRDIEAREIIPSFRAKTDRFQFNHRRDVPRIQHSHDYYSLLYRNKRVLLLVRDLRDSLVSHYERYSSWRDPGLSFGDFLREDGLPETVQSLSWRLGFLNSWGDNFNGTEAFQVVKYEDLKRNTASVVRDSLEFLQIEPLGHEFVERVVNFGLRDNMRRFEEGNSRMEKGKAKVSSDERTGTDQYFSEDNERYFRAMVEEHLEHDFGYGWGC